MHSIFSKFLIFSFSLLSFYTSSGQSLLTDPNSGCEYTLPWTCDECTVNWTGDCEDKLPTGTGILTVFHETDEIMRYEGEMSEGNFNGKGSYRDGMNAWEGLFENGNFTNDNPFEKKRKSLIDTIRFNSTDQWETKATVTKQIDNFYFTYPNSGMAYENREKYTQSFLDAFRENCELINVSEYTEFTKIRFVDSKKEMLLHSNLYIRGGAANYWTKSIHMMVSDQGPKEDQNTTPPIKHEVMHMVSMVSWGPPPQNLNWLNEGLATYAPNDCCGHSVGELYRYFLENDMLIPLDSLAIQFYGFEEMVSYHQSAYIVEYIITNYGIEKLEALWKRGFTSFESIFGISTKQLTKDINASILKTYPNVPDFDWEKVKNGCEE